MSASIPKRMAPASHGELPGLPARQRHLRPRRRRLRRRVQFPRRGGGRAQRHDRVPRRGDAGRDADRRGAGEEAGAPGRILRDRGHHRGRRAGRARPLRRSPRWPLIYGGTVITIDPAFRLAEAVAVADDRIVAVGGNAEVRALAHGYTCLIDLGGRAVVPGLVDVHAHMDREGLKTVCPSLAGAASIEDVLQRIEALVRVAAPGEWIVTMPLGDPPYYFDVPQNLKEGRFPTRWELDRVSPRNPVYIRAIWGYWRHTLPLVSIANSEALRLAGITRETVPPGGGRDDREGLARRADGALHRADVRAARRALADGRSAALHSRRALARAPGVDADLQRHGNDQCRRGPRRRRGG